MSAEEPKGHEEESDLYEHYKIVADPGQAPLRLDKFLLDRIPNTSRNRIQNAARSGNILVNQTMVKPNYKVKPGDQIAIVLPYPVREIELIPEDIPLSVVHEDEDLLVVNKPAGLVVHPGYGNYTGTLVNALMHHLKLTPDQIVEGGVRPGLVHRLDKNTTGLMVVAKSEWAHTHLAKQFFERTIDREYEALVWGDVETEGSVEGHIGRSPKNRKIMRVFPNGEMGKYAKTHYKVLERLGYVTHLQCKLETGRTHQIRVHLKYIKHPLFNDAEYGGDRIVKGTTFTKYKQFVDNCFKAMPRHALHAKTLGFRHPQSGERVFFESQLPEDFTQVLEKWRKYAQHRSE